MADPNNEKMLEALEKNGVNLADVLRDTHANTIIRVSSLMEETFELAIRMAMLKTGQKASERLFKRDGDLATLEKKINRAKELRLLDDVAHKDAHIIRKIRNKFAHTRDQLHFDSAKIIAMAQQLSTYEKAKYNQDAILAAISNIVGEAKSNARND
jgi:DNA-binding MltR family transcriptional regulator